MKNHILRALPPRELKTIVPHLRVVDLAKGAVLYEPGGQLQHVFFPAGAMASYLSGTEEGQTIEVCVIGNEGLIGGPSLLFDVAAFRAVVQIGGPAYRISTDALRQEYRRSEVLYGLLMRYINALLIQVAQTAVCNKFHSIEERICRWLLLAQDRTGSDQLMLTQDALARILGTRRASVTVAAGRMQKSGLIRYNRGVISIMDRARLEQAACECHETIVGAYSHVTAMHVG
jgi:CRP-like cAMP-binding protein